MERPQFDIVASGKRMRAIRKARKISVKQVVEYMGFESTQAVYKWEAGKCYPQADNLLALAMLYNVSPMELLVEEDKLASSFFVFYIKESKIKPPVAMQIANKPVKYKTVRRVQQFNFFKMDNYYGKQSKLDAASRKTSKEERPW